MSAADQIVPHVQDDEKTLGVEDPVKGDEIRDHFTYDESRRLLRKADFHILPILICLYLSKTMDTSLTSVSGSLAPAWRLD